METPTQSPLYGLIAEFDDPDQLLDAAQKTHDEGYRKIDAYTPFPVHGMAEAIGVQDTKVPWTVFICGASGAMGGIALQLYTMYYDYPLNVGGRPLISWPSYVPVTFECTILLSAFGAVLGMLLFNGLPRPHHSIFNAKNFERASQDRFFLCVEAADPNFDVERTEAFLRGLNPLDVSVVER